MDTEENSQRPSIVPDDFPDALGSMLVKELRQGIRSKRFAVPFLGVHAIMLLAFAIDVRWLRDSGGSSDFIIDGFGSQLAFWWAAIGLLVVIMPLTALGSLTTELENDGRELLALAGLSRWRIVLGKWATHGALAGLTAVTMLPYLLVRYFLGGMDLLFTFGICVSVLALNGAANALAIGVSGYQDAGMRWWVGFTMSGSFVISLAMLACSSAILGDYLLTVFSKGVSANVELRQGLGGIVGVFATCLLFCGFGWQLARVHLRTCTLRTEVNVTSAGVVAISLLTPIILGFALVLSEGYGALPCALLFMLPVLALDPQRSRSSA